MNKAALGNYIKTARKEQGMTTEQVSVLCEVNPVFIRKIESGAGLPSLSVFVKICNALDVSPEYLLQAELNTRKRKTDEEEIAKMVSGTTERQKNIIKNLIASLLASLKGE